MKLASMRMRWRDGWGVGKDVVDEAEQALGAVEPGAHPAGR
jgi:hypothetical protein